jgi:FeS assembly protein IscX
MSLANAWSTEKAAMKWTDTLEIAIQLSEAHPQVDPKTIRFTDLHKWVMALPEFDDDPNRSNEKILEAIQMSWIEEVE